MRALVRSHCLQSSAIGELKGRGEGEKRATEDGDVREGLRFALQRERFPPDLLRSPGQREKEGWKGDGER